MNIYYRNKIGNKPMSEVSEDDLRALRFKSVVNVDPLLCYWHIVNPRYEIKLDPWGRMFLRREKCMGEGWGQFNEIPLLDYCHFVELVEMFTDL